MPTLEEIAKSIPSMGGRQLGPKLRKYASLAPDDTAVVEVGTWLGSGTSYLSLGILDSNKKVELHCYDHFKASGKEMYKAKKEGVEIGSGQDTLPYVKSVLDQFNPDIMYHKGDIISCSYSGKPIFLYVDDASKRQGKFNHVMDTFGRFFIPNETFLILMDFYYFEKMHDKGLEYQKDYMENHAKEFEFVERPQHSSNPAILSSPAIFKYRG